MLSESAYVATEFGDFAVLDFGGEGHPVLMVHDVLDNAEYWRPAGELLAEYCRPVAVDLPGHGQTRVDGLDQQQTISALAQVIQALELQNPIIVGERAGGWVVTVATALGALHPAALVLLESAWAGSPDQMAEYFAQYDIPEFYDHTARRLRLGEHVPEGSLERVVKELLAAANSDWSFEAIPVHLLEAPVRRSMLAVPGGWRRQPDQQTLIRMVRGGYESPPRPSAAVYRRLRVPVTFVMTSESQYHDFPRAIDAMVAEDLRRRLVVVPANFNVSLTHPAAVADAVRGLLAALPQE